MRLSAAFLLLLSSSVHCQSWELVTSKAIANDITSYSFDERGAIYLGTSAGMITKLAREDDELTFSFPNSGPITLIEGRNALLPFLFFRDNQRAIVLDRFLSNPVVYEIDAFANGFIWLATPAIDRHLWLLKTSPLSILKVDPLSNLLVQATPLVVDFPLEEVVFFKAQRNLLIVVDKEYGVLVFDLFGNPVLSLEEVGLRFAHIDGTTLITYAEGNVIIQPLVQGAEAQIVEAPPGDFQAVIRRGARYHFIGRRKLDIFTLTEE